MKNRSKEYLSCRKKEKTLARAQAREADAMEEFFLRVSSKLSCIEQLVARVEKECGLYCIPSFKSKAGIAKRIAGLRSETALALARAKGVLEEFSGRCRRSINSALVEAVAVHFRFKLDRLISRMHLSLGQIDEARSAPSSSSSAEDVYKSVYYISGIIRELKGVVLSQSEKIERLDTAMDQATASAEKSKREISSLSAFGSHVKNRIITVLFFSIFILVVLSGLKAYTHK